MDFEQALVYELQAISGLEYKVFPQQAEDETTAPFVIYNSSEGERVMTLSGPTDLTELTCEFHICCNTYSELKSFSRAVIEKLMGFFRRTIGIDGPFIKSISYDEPIEEFDEDFSYHRSSFNIRVRF